MTARNWSEPLSVRIAASMKVLGALAVVLVLGAVGAVASIAGYVSTHGLDGLAMGAVLLTCCTSALAVANLYRYARIDVLILVDAQGRLTLDGKAAAVAPSTWSSGAVIGLALQFEDGTRRRVLIAPGTAGAADLVCLRTFVRWKMSVPLERGEPVRTI